MICVYLQEVELSLLEVAFSREEDPAEAALRYAWRLVLVVVGARWIFLLAEAAFFEELAEAA